MALPSIRRRIGALERALTPPANYPPFAPAEVEAIAQRIQAGDPLEAQEVERLEQHSPIVQGELIVTAHKRIVAVKRYIGVDLGEV